MKCRFCRSDVSNSFCDLGKTPLSNAYLKLNALKRPEPSYPLHAFVCSQCFLVQLDQFESSDQIFSDYAYFSSYSTTWLNHAKNYANAVVSQYNLGSQHFVVEIASNDGYLLQYFKEKAVPILGIEPAANVAKIAQRKGIPTLVKFFGVALAHELSKQGKKADLIIANNVLAHVPDLNDFVKGMKILLKQGGVITVEFPHLLQLIEQNQFDTIYHEHFSYFSLLTVTKVFLHHGLVIYDVEELPTHGGSLRIYATNTKRKPTTRFQHLYAQELAKQMNQMETYVSYGNNAAHVKKNLLAFFQQIKNDKKTIVGYGAPAKGNTLLNYCGITTKQLHYTVDASPHKQGLFLPGSHIPIYAPEKIQETKPDFLLILPWNLRDEIMQQMSHIKDWGGKFVIAIPNLKILS